MLGVAGHLGTAGAVQAPVAPVPAAVSGEDVPTTAPEADPPTGSQTTVMGVSSFSGVFG